MVFWLLLIVSYLRVGKQPACFKDISDTAFALSDISSGMPLRLIHTDSFHRVFKSVIKQIVSSPDVYISFGL